MALEAPCETLTVEAASVAPPGVQRLVANNINFALKAGSGLGIIGPSGSGKSSLARMLVGVWQPARGKIRLDGATYDQWSPEALGQHIGYLPQDVELLAGTIAENIARFAASQTGSRSSPRPKRPAFTILSSACRRATGHSLANRARRFRPAKRNALRLRARSLRRSLSGGPRRAKLKSRCRRR